jgi:hypothetical protein
MHNHPQTIQIYLPFGSARDIKIATITSRIMEAIFIPRSKLSKAAERDEVNCVGIYFLFGESDDSVKPIVYVGESENCYKRLNQHNQNKDFWQSAIIIRSKTNDFNRAHVRYLEYFCYSKITEVDRYKLFNSAVPAKPHIQEAFEAELIDYIDTITILLSTLGYPVLEDTHKFSSRNEIEDIFYCRGKDSDAKGRYLDDGFIVYKGSKITNDTAPASSYVIEKRFKLFESNIIEKNAEGIFFIRDHIFNSPSAASTVVLGRSSNGWMEWKDVDSKTLDELKRQDVLSVK